MSEHYPRKITTVTGHSFSVEQGGLYRVAVAARCQSGKQSGMRGGEDLRVEIDGLKLREAPARDKPQYQNIPPTWNGTELRGLKKTVVFLLRLEKGAHTIKFIPRPGAIIEHEPKIELIQDLSRVVLNLEDRAEDGDRRPWYTFVLVNLPLQTLSADVTVQWHFRDSDDIKLMVDSQIKKNNFSLFHRNWLWSGSILKKLFGTERQDKFFAEHLERSTHYIEFWSDRMPIVHTVELDLGEAQDIHTLRGRVALHQDIEETDFARVRREPSSHAEEITKLKQGDAVEILRTQVSGEYIQNKSDIWHKIKYQIHEGYILSSFVEIEGQERERVLEKIKDHAKAKGIDQDLALALAGCESRYKPYAVSVTGALGIYQLTGIARQDLEERFHFEITATESFDVDKNIEAGLTYLRWLIGIYGGTQDEYQKIAAAWNAGQSLIPAEGPISYAAIRDERKKEEVMRFVNRVETNRKRKNWRFIIMSVFFIALLLAGLTYRLEDTNHMFIVAPRQGEALGGKISSRSLFNFLNPYAGIMTVSADSVSAEPFTWHTRVMVETEGGVSSQEYSGFLENAYLFDVDFSGQPEVFLVRREGKQIITTLLQYIEEDKSLQPIKFLSQSGDESISACCSYLIYQPHSNGVQYDLAVNGYEGDQGGVDDVGGHQVVYRYDFLKKVFVEREHEVMVTVSNK